MAHNNSHIVFKNDSNTIISVYSDLLKNKVGDFLYDPKLSINLIQKEELASFDNINHLKIYIIHNATLTTSGAVKISILKQEHYKEELLTKKICPLGTLSKMC